jgi:uncharacterized protein with von Willebrand factor type A (vWA) domain
MLYDLAHLDDKSISHLMNESRYSVRGLHEKAWEHARERVAKAGDTREAKEGELRDLKARFSHKLLEDLAAGGDLDKLLEEYLNDDYRRQLEEELAGVDHREAGLEPEDVRNSLRDYVNRGLIEIDEDGVRITPKGSRRLAKYVLTRLWENLSPTTRGTNNTREEGFGISDGFAPRRHEYGDEFYRIDMEATLLAALERGKNGPGRIEFGPEDLWVRETIEDTKLSIGLIVDESGSMSGDKIHAAMDICLALSEVIRRNSRDRMRLFLFSNQVREMAHWDLLNATLSGGTTDIRSALRRFRTTVTGDRADKQVYLITDTEPNCEDGKYVGFERATLGVIQEAVLLKRDGITLNIVMLDNTPHLAEYASLLAKRNLGRVFFATPKDLGRVVMENYLRTKKRRGLKKAV